MYFTYTLLLTLALAVTFPYYLVKFRKYFQTISDRLGFLKIPRLRGCIWVHAVSVGEVRAIEKLVERLRQQFPARPVVVSTTTPTGQQLARERKDIIDHTFYFPLDLPWCVSRVLNIVDPHLVIIAETEIWPNFLRACRKRNVPVVMVNGRISDRSFGRYKLARRWLAPVLENYTLFGMQSETDRRRIEALGAAPEKVVVFGNLKYDLVDTSRPAESSLASLLSGWSPVWIAASTMPGEEELVLRAFTELRATRPELKLVLAPRNPERFDAVEALVKRHGLPYLRRSQLGAREAEPVLLLDSIGELAGLFQYATVVFMGGTLVARGGHNILEPARFSKPVVFGPHMENFRDMSRLFLDAGAALQIADAAELAPAVRRLLNDPGTAAELGRKARAIVDANSGATDRVLQFLEPAGAIH